MNLSELTLAEWMIIIGMGLYIVKVTKGIIIPDTKNATANALLQQELKDHKAYSEKELAEYKAYTKQELDDYKKYNFLLLDTNKNHIHSLTKDLSEFKTEIRSELKDVNRALGVLNQLLVDRLPKKDE